MILNGGGTNPREPIYSYTEADFGIKWQATFDTTSP